MLKEGSVAIEIIAAVYGTENAGSDVTAVVQTMVDNGNDDVPVNNQAMQGDPDKGVRKYFGILYRLPDGRTLARTAVEGTTLDLVT